MRDYVDNIIEGFSLSQNSEGALIGLANEIENSFDSIFEGETLTAMYDWLENNKNAIVEEIPEFAALFKVMGQDGLNAFSRVMSENWDGESPITNEMIKEWVNLAMLSPEFVAQMIKLAQEG